MTSVRVVNVGNAPYVQVVEYYRRPNGKQAIKVIQSFGRYSVENWLRANQYSASYNQLKEVAKIASSTRINWDEFWKGALAAFGAILGATIVGSILEELFGED